jgi:hypothetical protein
LRALEKVQGNADISAGVRPGGSAIWRPTNDGGWHLKIQVLSIQPSRIPTTSLPPAVVARKYDLLVPLDSGGDAEFQLREEGGMDEFLVRIEELLPSISGTLQIRSEMFAERVVAQALADLRAEIDRVNRRLS